MAMRLSRALAGLERVGSREADDAVAAAGVTGLLVLRGAPVRPFPPHIRDAAIEALSGPDRRTTRGLAELREALAALLEPDVGTPVDPARELLVTNGAMQGLGTVFRALLDPGDEVVVPTPNFFFGGSIRLAGGMPVHVPCLEEDGWSWDLDRIGAVIAERTRAIVVCNPTNPTGFLPAREDLAGMLELARAHDLFVLSDES